MDFSKFLIAGVQPLILVPGLGRKPAQHRLFPAVLGKNHSRTHENRHFALVFNDYTKAKTCQSWHPRTSVLGYPQRGRARGCALIGGTSPLCFQGGGGPGST